MAHDDSPQLLTVQEVAQRLRVTEHSLYSWIRRGLVPGVVRLGRSIRLRSAEVDRWIDAGGIVGGAA